MGQNRHTAFHFHKKSVVWKVVSIHVIVLVGLALAQFLIFNLLNKMIYFVALTTNLTKVRPLLTLSHRGSDNTPLLIDIVFKWTLNELCICILRQNFDQSGSVFFKCNAVFLKMTKVDRLAYFQSHESNDWLVDVISTEWGVIRSSVR